MRTLKRLVRQLLIAVGVLAVLLCSLVILPAYQTFSGMKMSGMRLEAQSVPSHTHPSSDVVSGVFGLARLFAGSTTTNHYVSIGPSGLVDSGVVVGSGGGGGAGLTPGTGLIESPSGVMAVDPAAVYTTIQTTVNLDFASTPAGQCSATQTVSFPGAALGNVVGIGEPASLEGGVHIKALVLSANTLRAMACNGASVTRDPLNQSFTFQITRPF